MKKPVKALLVFFNGKSNAGGAERMVLYLDEYLVSRGYSTEIIDERLLMSTPGGKLLEILFRHRHFIKRKPIYMARLASAYLWTRRRKGQIVISNGESTPFYPVDLVVSQGCYHAMEKDYGRKSETLSRVAKLQQLGIQKATLVIAVTEKVKENLIKYYGIDARKFEIVSNRVDTNYFNPLPQPDDAERTIVYVGRLEKGKGLDLLVRLASYIEKSQEWKFLIACNNEYNTDLFKSFTRTHIKIGLQLENINADAYSKAGIVIFPSHSESFGMVTIEALAAGVPVVATPVGIIPELAARKYPGVYVLNPDNGNELLIQFEQMIRDFHSQVDRNNLHETVRKEFGIESYRERLDEVFYVLNNKT